jgi:hypothetical protein
MTTNRVFSGWDDTHSKLWGHHPIQLAHELHKSLLFSIDTLAELIQRYPREHYSLVQTGGSSSGRVWREGEIGNPNGRQVIDAISRGGLWLNLRDVGTVDSRYRTVIDGMFEEIAARVPGFQAPKHQAGILISSPDAQVHYHADLPGQGLIQIPGESEFIFIRPLCPSSNLNISKTSRCSMSRSICPTRIGTTRTRRSSISNPVRC